MNTAVFNKSEYAIC